MRGKGFKALIAQIKLDPFMGFLSKAAPGKIAGAAIRAGQGVHGRFWGENLTVLRGQILTILIDFRGLFQKREEFGFNLFQEFVVYGCRGESRFAPYRFYFLLSIPSKIKL